jgi:hypothetical protein
MLRHSTVVGHQFGHLTVAIDDPRAKFEDQYLRDEEKSPAVEIAIFLGKLALPQAAIPLEIFEKVQKRFTQGAREDRFRALWELLRMELDRMDTIKANVDDLAAAMQFMLWRDTEQFDDRKRDRYVKVFGNAARSDTQIDNVMSLVQTIEQLNEHDVIVLKVLNTIMNKDGDWRSPNNSFDPWKLHSGVFIQRASELTTQVAQGLGQSTDRSTFSREMGYAVCTRLVGFGLAHEIELQARELPLTEYCFRLSTEGVKLLKLMGEDVPNFEYYFPTS